LSVGAPAARAPSAPEPGRLTEQEWEAKRCCYLLVLQLLLVLVLLLLQLLLVLVGQGS